MNTDDQTSCTAQDLIKMVEKKRAHLDQLVIEAWIVLAAFPDARYERGHEYAKPRWSALSCHEAANKIDLGIRGLLSWPVRSHVLFTEIMAPSTQSPLRRIRVYSPRPVNLHKAIEAFNAEQDRTAPHARVVPSLVQLLKDTCAEAEAQMVQGPVDVLDEKEGGSEEDALLASAEAFLR